MHKKPAISVVIPAFNEERYLRACLLSLRQQDIDVEYELIVVDNGSTDATADIAREYGARVVFEPRKGICYAREAGTRQAEGTIIVSTDADCVTPRDWLQKIYDAFLIEPELVGVAGRILYEPKPFWGRAWSRGLFWAVGAYYKLFGVVMYISACNFAFSKCAWEKAGGYNVRLAQGGDEYDLLFRLRSQGHVAFLPNNTALTSSRRLVHGILYSFFVTVCYYYLFDYFVLSRLTGRSVAGLYPEFRGEQQSRLPLSSKFAVGALVILIGFGIVLGSTPLAKATQIPRHQLSATFHTAKNHIQQFNTHLDSCTDNLPACTISATSRMIHFAGHRRVR